MTELRHGAAMAAVTPPFAQAPRLRPMLLQGGAGLALGAGLTVSAVAWSQGVLGFLGLMMVVGSLGWIAIGVVRHYAGRLRRA